MAARAKPTFSWILRSVAALIMLQTLYFKFTAAEESVFIFSQLHMEPWGRIGTGVLELIASILIVIPRTTAIGALLALGIIGGAIFSHLFFIGISIQGDGGQLFFYALTVFVAAAILLYWNWRQLLQFVPAKFVPAKLLRN
jgi:uncharacterized membrane protein YphA (DoxX/SURF4 family)